jgi:hypothetical protein
MRQTWKGRGMHTGHWGVGRQKERGDKGDLDVEDNIKIHLKEIG